jgi:hypothetical protein
MHTLTNTLRRVLAALALLVFLTSVANYQFALHVFGRFDKLALILGFVFMFVVVHFLKPDISKRRPTFSWARFSLIAGVVIGATAWVAWGDYQSGRWDIGRGAFLLIPATLVIFLGHRWRLLRKELLDGTFSEERYHADPGTYMMGPLRQLIVWMLIAVAIVVAVIFLYVALAPNNRWRGP